MSVCSYRLIDDGWEPTDSRPTEILELEKASYHWYSNDRAEILVCPNVDASNVCGGIYTVYEKSELGYQLIDEIVCIT